MTDSAALDGNAIGGLLFDVFGGEMTTATGTCGSCHARVTVAEFVVYLRAPGTVARCRSCGSVLMVVTARGGRSCVDLRGLASLDVAPDADEG